MFNIVFFEDIIPTDRNPKKIGDSNLSTLKNGSKMFIDCSDISSFKSDLSSLINGYQMFQGCSNLVSFTSELPSLTDAKWMFGYCSKLKTFTSDLSNVTDGDGAFYYCSDLTTFSTNLSNLSTGKQMFHYCTKLESFNVDLMNLCHGSSMFRGCEKLTSFTSDLSKLTYAKNMFNNCKNLTTVTSNLSSLVCGAGMFKNNRLSPMSVIYIIDSIRDIAAEKKLYEDGIKSYVTKNDETGIYSASRGFMSDGGYVYEKDGKIEKIGKSEVGTLTLGIDVINESATLEEQLQSFAEEAFFDSWAELQEMFAEKGWSVTFEYCGISQNYKYKGCKTVDDVKAVDPNYKTTDIVNGVWSERLDDLEQGGNGEWNGGMFNNCRNLTTFSSDLPSLTDGTGMFCYSGLESFSSDLSSLTDGFSMFRWTSNLKSFSSDLSSLTDGSGMFYCSALASFSSNLSSLTNGGAMFKHGAISSFNSNMPNLTNGSQMFYLTKFESFSSDLSSLTNGKLMFYSCTALTTFSSNLSSLTDGELMFYRCTALTTFSSDLSSLTNGCDMFSYCEALASFSSDSSGSPVNLSSLTDGYRMFFGCSSLTSFTSDLSSLTDGDGMFEGCYHLTSFTSDLSSLTSGYGMFGLCKLDTASVQNIADTINTPSTKGMITVVISNTTPNEQEKAAFNTIASKNWTVYVGVNGSWNSTQWNPTSLTPLDGEETTAPIPYYAKPVPATEERARYIDNDGNYYNILGGNYVYGDDLSTYGMFVSEEDAAANMRLTKYVKEVEEK